MLRNIVFGVFLLDGVLMSLMGIGHAFSVRLISKALAPFPVDPASFKVLHLVWFFVSGAMLVFGLTVIRSGFQLRAGDAGPLFAVLAIGALYVAAGAGGAIYTQDLFWVQHVVIGGVLLLASPYLAR